MRCLLQNRLRKKIIFLIFVAELNWRAFVLARLVFFFGLWQLEIGMQLSSVFCLKQGEICILIRWPLVPNSKVNNNALDYLVSCLILLLHEVKFCFCIPL